MPCVKGLCNPTAQKENQVSFGRKTVRLFYRSISFPMHEYKMFSLLSDSHIKWKRDHGLSKTSYLPDDISMRILPFKVQSFHLKIIQGAVQSLCQMLVFKEGSFKRQNMRSKQCKNQRVTVKQRREERRERIWFCLSTEIVLIQYLRCVNFPYACVRSTT